MLRRGVDDRQRRTEFNSRIRIARSRKTEPLQLCKNLPYRSGSGSELGGNLVLSVPPYFDRRRTVTLSFKGLYMLIRNNWIAWLLLGLGLSLSVLAAVLGKL